ncbi:hypothetical protein GCM10027580_25270 [Corynebacterium faecale]
MLSLPVTLNLVEGGGQFLVLCESSGCWGLAARWCSQMNKVGCFALFEAWNGVVCSPVSKGGFRTRPLGFPCLLTSGVWVPGGARWCSQMNKVGCFALFEA